MRPKLKQEEALRSLIRAIKEEESDLMAQQTNLQRQLEMLERKRSVIKSMLEE